MDSTNDFRGSYGANSINVEISDKYDGITVKDFLKSELHLSATLIKHVKFGGIHVNGNGVTVRAVLKVGDELVIDFPSENSENIEPIATPLKIIYEDEDLLAVDKPADMPVHPSKGNHMVTLANAVAAYMGGNFVFRAINRLDRDTSGIVIIAKNQFVASRLSDSMKNGAFEKSYHALLASTPTERCGIINAPIEREMEGNIKRVVRSDGKQAITEYTVLRSLADGRALCEIRLHTGRTHQIRVHMAHIGAPLFADFLYGCAVLGKKYYLRCTNIRFPHPITEQIIDLRVPHDFPIEIGPENC